LTSRRTLGFMRLMVYCTRFCTLWMLSSGMWQERPGEGVAAASIHNSLWLVTTQ
jgi:hypothetical protein